MQVVGWQTEGRFKTTTKFLSTFQNKFLEISVLSFGSVSLKTSNARVKVNTWRNLYGKDKGNKTEQGQGFQVLTIQKQIWDLPDRTTLHMNYYCYFIYI